jgi:hypothetical protein
MIAEILQWIAIFVLTLFLLGCVLAVVVIPWAIWQVKKEQEQEKLPFQCMITEKMCIMPEEPCTECTIYKERINEIIDESEDRNIQDNKTEGR